MAFELAGSDWKNVAEISFLRSVWAHTEGSGMLNAN